ncbi:MAG: DUF423 domain-containing protein [Gammaproteobacteria bacterium]|nr:DUF423 domain-containing protein [Gammaproteobacteria bacterium]
MSRQALSLAAINGFLVVTFGAFGAHMLEEKISADMLDVFNTGIQYHMFHVVALIATALLGLVNEKSGKLFWCNALFLVGIILFSGSLYVLALTGMTWLGMITPIGGVAFLGGWVLLFIEINSVRHG